MFRLWHNPRCSKSRAALALLSEAGHVPEIFRYLDGVTDDILDAVLQKLALPPGALIRTGQAEWKASGLTPEAPPAAIRAAMIATPILIERPILETADAAVIGRPPERVLQLL